MKTWTAVTFGLAALLIIMHLGVLWQAHSPQRDPNGYEYMVLFFYGVPFSIAVAALSLVALKTKKAKRFRVPLAVGLLPLAAWPTIILLEFFRVIP